MSKILTDKEMLGILQQVIVGSDVIDCADDYSRFLGDLGDFITQHFGGIRGAVCAPDKDLGWTVAFRVDEDVPADGGVYKEYDKDVTWKDGIET